MRWCSIALLVGLPVVPWSATGAEDAETPGPDAAPSAPAPAPGVDLDLDRLLRVPSVAPPAQQQLWGRTERGWQTAFAEARQEVEELETRIEETQTAMREASSGNMTFSPTGGGPSTDPEVMRLRNSLKRDRRSLETARQRLRDLEVEASLAGVPDAWQRPASPEDGNAPVTSDPE
jgi:hypothetical protein